MKQAQRSRFQLEKQRRAGSSQIWELLSYTGKFSEEELQRLLEEVAKNAQRQQEDVKRNKELKSEAKKLKARWRYGNHLMRRLESKVGTVAQLTPEDVELVDAMKDGSMKRQVNEMVMQRGRGRLRGASATDYYDMGTNREFSAVQECLDGPVTRPDLSRFLTQADEHSDTEMALENICKMLWTKRQVEFPTDQYANVKRAKKSGRRVYASLTTII